MFRYIAYILGYTNAQFNIQKCPIYIKIEGAFLFPPKGVFWPTMGGGGAIFLKVSRAIIGPSEKLLLILMPYITWDYDHHLPRKVHKFKIISFMMIITIIIIIFICY